MSYTAEESARMKIAYKAIITVLDNIHLYDSKYVEDRLNYYLKQLHNLILEKGKENAKR